MENNVNEVKNNEKSFNFFGVILGVILAVGCAIGGYYLGVNSTKDEALSEQETNNTDKKDEDKNDDKEEAKEEKAPEKNSKYTFVKEYKKTYNFNDKNIDVLVYYYKGSEEWTLGPSTTDGPTKLNVVRMDLFVNGEKLIDAEPVLANEDNTYSEQFVNTDPNSGLSFKTFKDSFNSGVYYLMSMDEINFVNSAFEQKYVYLFTEEGKVLSKFQSWTSSGLSVIYGDQSMIGDRTAVFDANQNKYKLYSNGLVDIHENYLMLRLILVDVLLLRKIKWLLKRVKLNRLKLLLITKLMHLVLDNVN